jgi:hypothetical protein
MSYNKKIVTGLSHIESSLIKAMVLLTWEKFGFVSEEILLSAMGNVLFGELNDTVDKT